MFRLELERRKRGDDSQAAVWNSVSVLFFGFTKALWMSPRLQPCRCWETLPQRLEPLLLAIGFCIQIQCSLPLL